MDKDVKITLSLFLTWLVFGLFNLFGQPQAFVPPIIVDGLMVVGLGIYFCFPFRKNHFYVALLLFPLIILLLSSYELGWIHLNTASLEIVVIFCFLFPIQLIIGAISILKKQSILFWSVLLISIFNLITMITGYYELFSPQSYLPFSIHIASGVLSLLSIITIVKNNLDFETLKRILLLILLNMIFDIGNYLALLVLR